MKGLKMCRCVMPEYFTTSMQQLGGLTSVFIYKCSIIEKYLG
jgi:hypothetical protein